ncbi:MAG: hypothetical protein R3B70_23960 [Polyangiaceae bacterium]
MSGKRLPRDQAKTGTLRNDKLVTELTVGELLALLRAHGDAGAGHARSQVRTAEDASPPETQIKLLRRLISSPIEMQAFMADPPGYARSQGVTMDPQLVRAILDAVLFGDALNERVAADIDPQTIEELVGKPGALAWPAAVSAAAAVVSAAAAVVSAVTAVKKHSGAPGGGRLGPR